MRCRVLWHLIWVYTVCADLSVQVLTVNVVYCSVNVLCMHLLTELWQACSYFIMFFYRRGLSEAWLSLVSDQSSQYSICRFHNVQRQCYVNSVSDWARKYGILLFFSHHLERFCLAFFSEWKVSVMNIKILYMQIWESSAFLAKFRFF